MGKDVARSSWDALEMRATASRWNALKKFGPYGKLFLFLTKKEPTIHEAANDEDDRSSADEEGEHNVESFMLCSVVHPACSQLLQGFLKEEELCKVVSDMPFFVGRFHAFVRTERICPPCLFLSCGQFVHCCSISAMLSHPEGQQHSVERDVMGEQQL